MNEEKVKVKNEFELKVKGTHPAKKFQLGKHTISNVYKKYVLSEDEIKELKTKGPAHWLEIKK